MGIDWTDRLELLVTSFRDFSRMIVWPHPLRASYDDYAARGVLYAAVILGLVVAIAIAMRRRTPALSVGIAFFYVALLPLLPPLLVPGLAFVSVVAERYVYLPSVGAALAIAAVLVFVARRGRRLLWAVSLTVCLLLAVVTVRRNAEWSSDIALWEAEVAAAPENWGAWKWLTAAYMNAGRLADVVAVCDRELPLHPRGTGFHLNCGQVYLSQGRRSDAEAAYRHAVATDGGAIPHMSLARLLVTAGRAAEADAEYEAARAAERDHVRQQTIRGEQLRKLHPDRLAEAQAAYEAALVIDPRYRPAQTGLEMVKRMRGSPR
jgi:tetratricopeptide (TPR) repeat protein